MHIIQITFLIKIIQKMSSRLNQQARIFLVILWINRINYFNNHRIIVWIYSHSQTIKTTYLALQIITIIIYLNNQLLLPMWQITYLLQHQITTFLHRIINQIYFRSLNNKVSIYIINLPCFLKITYIHKIIISSPNQIYLDLIMVLDNLLCMDNKISTPILWAINNLHFISQFFNHNNNN